MNEIKKALENKLGDYPNRADVITYAEKGLCDDDIRKRFLDGLQRKKTITRKEVLLAVLNLRMEAGYIGR